MNAMASIKDLQKELRTCLISQSGLTGDFIRNSLSLYGEDLQKALNNLLQPDEYTSITGSDTMILFKLSLDSEVDIHASFINDKDESKIYYYKSFEYFLYIYGDSSDDIALKLKARLRSQAVRDALQEKGIHIISIENPEQVNEYINDVMWKRCDLSIKLGCKFIINPIATDYDINQINKMEVI